jgi:hypothetical protein
MKIVLRISFSIIWVKDKICWGGVVPICGANSHSRALVPISEDVPKLYRTSRPARASETNPEGGSDACNGRDDHCDCNNAGSILG